MAHFAELNNNNIVLRVLVVKNEDILDENGIEQEQKGIDLLTSLFGSNWIQTSYNAKIRKCYASIGATYDAEKDAFYPVKRFLSWVFNETDWCWEAPTPMPTDDKFYTWNESTLSWVEVAS
jgi:hypothetical protein